MLSWKTERKIVLCICGGIAAYKAIDLVRYWSRCGCEVEVVLSEAAENFVSPLTLSTLSGKKCWLQRDFLSAEEGWRIPHITLADWADVVVVAPATAETLRRLASGEAKTLIGALVLATRAPVVLFPSMNVHMWEHDATRLHAKECEKLGYRVVDPDYGLLACGYEGKGKLPETEVILEETWRALCPKNDFKGKRVLVTAGPTWEFIDPVRFISNPSSGKMGFSLAKTAWYRGARVKLVSGPVALPDPPGIETHHVVSAEEMQDAVLEALPTSDIIVKAAAVGDFRPKARFGEKIKRNEKDLFTLELEQNPDIAAEVGRRKRPDQVLIGFAAESQNLFENASAKIKNKNLDLIVANDVTAQGAGFGSDDNRVKVIAPEGLIAEISGSKEVVAEAIWGIVSERYLNPSPPTQ